MTGIPFLNELVSVYYFTWSVIVVRIAKTSDLPVIRNFNNIGHLMDYGFKTLSLKTLAFQLRIQSFTDLALCDFTWPTHIFDWEYLKQLNENTRQQRNSFLTHACPLLRMDLLDDNLFDRVTKSIRNIILYSLLWSLQRLKEPHTRTQLKWT